MIPSSLVFASLMRLPFLSSMVGKPPHHRSALLPYMQDISLIHPRPLDWWRHMWCILPPRLSSSHFCCKIVLALIPHMRSIVVTDRSQQRSDCFEEAFYEMQHHLVFHIASSNCLNQLNPHQSSLLSMGTEFIKQNIWCIQFGINISVSMWWKDSTLFAQRT